jgi:hypothetical protein
MTRLHCMYTRLFFTVNLDGTKVPASEYTSIRYLPSVHALPNSKRDDAVQVRACCLRKKASSSHHASARAAMKKSSSSNRSKQRQATRLFKESHAA